MTAAPAHDPASGVLREAARLGVELVADGDRLRFRPAAVVGPELRARLAESKGKILSRLAARDARRRLATVIRAARRAGDAARAAALRDNFEERAATREFEGGQARDDAERLAALEAVACCCLAVKSATKAAPSAFEARPPAPVRDSRGFLLPARDARGFTALDRAERWRRESRR